MYNLKVTVLCLTGLSYIHEIRRKEPNVPPIYNCFLCHASIATVPLVTEHVISMKHRLNYIVSLNIFYFILSGGNQHMFIKCSVSGRYAWWLVVVAKYDRGQYFIHIYLFLETYFVKIKNYFC